MNGDSGMYDVQRGDLHGPRDAEIMVEEELRKYSLPTNGTGIAKLMRLMAFLIETKRV